MKNTLSVKTIVATGIGAAVFLVLGQFASIPTGIPNTEVQTAYAFLALLAVVYGPIAGALAGLIGHALKDLIFYGAPWWSWVIPSGIVGLVIGVYGMRSKVSEGVFEVKNMISFNITQIVANALAWFLLAPALDVLIYQEPLNVVVMQGLVAGVANMVTVGVLGTTLIFIYAKAIPKKGSLTKE